MKKIISDALIKAGASDVGICRARVYSELIPVLKKQNAGFCETDIKKRINPFLIMPYAKSVIVFVVSYKSKLCGNISSYAYGRDYHKVLPEIAENALKILNNNGYRAKFFSDTSNLCDRHLGYLAGLGFLGKNRCLIHPVYGSFIFIGYIITDCPLKPDKPLSDSCAECGKCIESCPSKALSSGNFNSCLSFITQKKGELTNEEKALIKSSGSVWGCDICQNVCPHNKNAPEASIGAFSKNLLTNLSVDKNITNKDFKNIYADRAFSWRGKNVILRNLEILN